MITIPSITREWISATKTRNYMLDNCLIDWLNLFGVSKGFDKDVCDEQLDFSKFIMSQGLRFESMIMSLLKSKFGSDLVELDSGDSFKLRMEKTMRLMSQGVPIISQGMIFNSNYKVYGSPDLLVRSDYLNNIIDVPVIVDNNGCRFSSSWHYRVVDIKFSTLRFKNNFKTLYDSGSVLAYKSQLYIYTACLDYMQNYNPFQSYILGRGWERDDDIEDVTLICNDPFSRLGVIDYKYDDLDVVESSVKAIDWYRTLLMKGSSWDVFPFPSIKELYPNMKELSNCGWDNVKRDIAYRLKEITLLWNCDVSNRCYAHSKGIYGWDVCNSNLLNIKGKKSQSIIDKIIKVNKSEKVDIIPDTILSTMFDWRYENPCLEFFINVESVTSVVNINDNSFSVNYSIGLGYIENSNWKYKNFTVNRLNTKDEKCILGELIVYISHVINKQNLCPNCKYSVKCSDDNHLLNCSCHLYCNNCSFVYCPSNGWYDGYAQCQCDEYDVNISTRKQKIKLFYYDNEESNMCFDKNVMNEIGEENNLLNITNNIEFCDLRKLLKSEPFIIKGCFDFSLKNITNALYKNNKIKSYNNSNDTDRIVAAYVASNSDLPFRGHDLIKEIIKQNELKCYSIYEILDYIRINH